PPLRVQFINLNVRRTRRQTRTDQPVSLSLAGVLMPSLHILKGANQGATLPLQKERFVIGRNPECDVVIPVTSVSREHAQLLRMQGRYHIEDLQSRNGTFVNNQAITARTVLKNNDRIRIFDFLAR